MADIRHKFIPDAELHDPKGFGTASNKTVLTKDENGVSRYVATTVLEKALNFVDGNAAPPTEVLGAIYVLIDEGNGAVDSGWDGASYDDWVRFNGTTWVPYTPSEGVFCYNATDNTLYLFTTSWDQYGVGSNMANTNLTLDANRTHDLAGYNLTFSGGTTIHEGADTLSSSSHTKFYDGDTTPSLLWDWRNNGDVHLSGAYNMYGVLNMNNTADTVLSIERDNSSVNNSLLLPLRLKNSSASYVDYTEIYSKIISNTAGSESGELGFNILDGGTNRAVIISTANGVNFSNIISNSTATNKANFGEIIIKDTSQVVLEGTGSKRTRMLAVKRNSASGSTGIEFQNSSSVTSEIYHTFNSALTVRVNSGGGIATAMDIYSSYIDMGTNRIKSTNAIPSVSSAASTTTLTVNSDTTALSVLTNMAVNTTIASPTGTPEQGQKLMFRFKDNGTSRTLTWNAIFRAIGVTLPAATTISKTLYVDCVYNSTDTKWDVVDVKEEL